MNINIKKTNKTVIGYTQGVFDMFHVGHLNLLNNAKKLCDYLIVGVNSDQLVETYKNHRPVISEIERKQIVENIKAVDECHIVHTLDKYEAYQKYKFNRIFIGSDWRGNPRWEETKTLMDQLNVELFYLPYTNGISSTQLRPEKKHRVQDNCEAEGRTLPSDSK